MGSHSSYEANISDLYLVKSFTILKCLQRTELLREIIIHVIRYIHDCHKVDILVEAKNYGWVEIDNEWKYKINTTTYRTISYLDQAQNEHKDKYELVNYESLIIKMPTSFYCASIRKHAKYLCHLCNKDNDDMYIFGIYPMVFCSKSCMSKYSKIIKSLSKS